jgi:hypothetical protein
VQLYGRIPAVATDLTADYHDCADRSFIGARSLACEPQSFAHIFFVGGQKRIHSCDTILLHALTASRSIEALHGGD